MIDFSLPLACVFVNSITSAKVGPIRDVAEVHNYLGLEYECVPLIGFGCLQTKPRLSDFFPSKSSSGFFFFFWFQNV